jgi:hypothetical protein
VIPPVKAENGQSVIVFLLQPIPPAPIDFLSERGGMLMIYTILLLGFVGLSLFLLGYYFGNQMGRTEYIRGYLAETRKSSR